MDLPTPQLGLVKALARWQQRAGRAFPWRTTTNPFHILTAEIFLQRTRADQVLPVYKDFTEVADTPNDVIGAGSKQVDAWFGALGLEWRAHHYWNLCRELVATYGGEVPADRDALMSLPGVGQYAAGSTLSYAFDRPTGVTDSNILRVYSRYYGIQFSDSDRRHRDVLEWASSHLPEDPDEARIYSLGLVDLGAMICKPRNPACGSCPLVSGCLFAQ